MDFVFELISELFLEGIIGIASNSKINNGIRYPIITIVILFFIAVIFGLIYLGAISLTNSLIGGIFIILLALALLSARIYKFIQFYSRKKNYFKS